MNGFLTSAIYFAAGVFATIETAVLALTAYPTLPQQLDGAIPDVSLLEYGALGVLVIVIGLWTWERRSERQSTLSFQERVIDRNTTAMEQLSREMALLNQRLGGGN